MPHPPLVTLAGTNARLLGERQNLDFFDSQTVRLCAPIEPLEAWNTLMARPMPVLNFAFWVRDAVSSKFGVKRIGGFTQERHTTAKVGETLAFFLIEEATDTALSLSERDRHLDVLTCVSVEGADLTITSSIKTHNAFGRLYMIPVGPAHRLIVQSMLKHLKATHKTKMNSHNSR